ncbi:MAG: tetratricopeptide repeat protein [Verrucomicrobiota bacterium]
MKSRFLIAIFLLVTAIHVALFVMTQRKDSGDGDEVVGDTSTAETSPSGDVPLVRPIPASPPSEEPESAGNAESAVNDAVGLIRKSESVAAARPLATESIPESSSPAGTVSDPSENGATMTVGLAEGKSKLPPELFEVAEEGAKAVAAQNWEKARELYLRMVNEAPENALGYANLGVAEHQLGNLLAAAGNLQRSLDINPSIAQNWQTLGIIRYERGELELAISALTRAIHEDPSDASSRLYLAAVIRNYGWIEASITELERAVEADPKFADAHYNLAVSYLELEPPRTELARRHYYFAVDLGAEPSVEIEAVFQSFDENE